VKPAKFGLGSIVVDDEKTVWVNRKDFLRLLDVCTSELGVRYLDSAQGYQKSEEAIGLWLQGKDKGVREKLIIGSKVTRKPMDRAAVNRIGRESLQKLNCGAIDIYWTHRYDSVTPVLETYRGFNDLAEAGVIREVGICNVNPEQILEILSTCRAHGLRSPTYVQNEFNLLNFRAEQEITRLCMNEGLTYMAFSPLAGGILTGKYKFDEPLPADSRWGTWQKTRGLPSYWNAQCFNAMTRFAEKSAELGVSMAVLALAWCKYRPDVSTTLLGPRHIGHLDAVRDALNTQLTDAQLQEITDMFS
jgi:aryl-alcohol dehydrogenase-like predicted oxidoreductase